MSANEGDMLNGKRETTSSDDPERRTRGQDPEWEGFKDYVKKMAQVPKEELDEKLAEEKREKQGKRAEYEKGKKEKRAG